ncbi:hypothetical protein PLESTB_001656100 [Pleodorina starrii]|uniref:Uncharacterized protein n=1 Tax=Pleodorina starrii TaxID=330485 RepID=A0A9W6BZK0_9CHLO|nr:hypothetical protein PLESTB_001656100 [Pleodorina starrii]GLC69666.1 hypothetical protein PLESTF_000862300 [Pleodorina starrii]
MANYSEDSASSLDDSDDLDDIPLSMAPNGRYEHDEPPMTSRGPPMGFSRPGPGFHLKLPTPKPQEELVSPGPDGLQAMRSEPVYLPETARVRPQPGLSLSMGPPRGASSSYNGAADESGPLLARRGPLKPPMLSLVNPASASPVPSVAPTPGVNEAGEPLLRAHAWPPPRQQPLRVDLVSSAFVLQDCGGGRAAAAAAGGGGGGGGASTSERIVQRCCSQLGISASELEFFELRPLEEGVIPESCGRLGVMIRGSAFSLSALEDLLARSKRDGQLATMLEGALRDSSQHAAEAKQHAEKLAKQNEELAVLRERLRGLEASNQHLREQLQRSDEHRQLLGGTIRTIKKEFEDFKSRVVVEGSLALPTEQLPPLQQLNLGAVAPAAAGAGGGPAAGAGGAAAAAAFQTAPSPSPVASPAPLMGSPQLPMPGPSGGDGDAAGAAAPAAPRDGAGRR